MKRSLYRRITAITLLVLLAQLGRATPILAVDYSHHPDKVTLTVSSSQSSMLFSTLTIDSPAIVKAIIRSKKESAAAASILPDLEVSLLQKNGQITRYSMEKSGMLWDDSEKIRLLLPPLLSEQLLHYAAIVRQQHYGKLMPWEEAGRLVPRKSKFTITDLDTGLSFQVQRRAGSDHADVQPLTIEDSTIMKQIYNQHWSWNRRAILVQSGQERLAASMNGMPHGGDGIPGNGFSGHFCVHFYQSTTHKADSPDPIHQLMVHKAAGELETYFNTASPVLLSTSFIEALHQQDPNMLRQLSSELLVEELDYFLKDMKSIDSIQAMQPVMPGIENSSEELSPIESLITEIDVRVNIKRTNTPPEREVFHFVLQRNSFYSAWKIQNVQINIAK